MKNLYLLNLLLTCMYCMFVQSAISQTCTDVNATCTGYESRCAATGSIKVTATGGSGNFKYKVNGPVNINFTSSDSITGLSAGSYNVTIYDINRNCSIVVNNIIVSGSYADPRFVLDKTDVGCDNGSNGSISVNGQLNGLAPFTYSIVAPSPMGVGTTNNTGVFNNLIAGQYAIRLTDSCGGIQTRQITINNYSWSLTAYPFTKTSCFEATGYIEVRDSRGNISTVSGISGFMYGVVLSPGDTTWSNNPNFTVSLLGSNSFQVVAKDSCGTIKTGPVNVNLEPQVGNVVLITNKTCNTFTASVTGVVNVLIGQYCLYDSAGIQLACNNTGTFDNLPYGRYCISIHDNCTDTYFNRCFTATPPPLLVASDVFISNKTCLDFTASITGQTGFNTAEYCLYDSTNTLINCNGTGVFNNLPYGPYCIIISIECRDTSITRCFTAVRPRPYIAPIVPSYLACTSFGISVGGDTLGMPRYCLYDTAGVLIICNNTGIFDSLAYGSYCVNMFDSCYDTTIVRCFSVDPPVLQNDIRVRVTDYGCSLFSINIAGANLTRPEFCLYDSIDRLIGCNSTGTFVDLPYGSYCVKAKNNCPDTTLVHCFTISPLVPSVNANIATNATDCMLFTASVTGQENLTKPEYCIYDSSNNLIECNNGGVFNNLSFGSYCIKITNTCYDTVITRCFSRLAIPMTISVSSNKSCAYNYSRLAITMSNANLPVSIQVYRPDSSLYLSEVFNTNPVLIDSMPGIAPGRFYKIVATDACGNKDSATSGTEASYYDVSTTVTPKCPGSTWANGSGNITITISSNMGSNTVRIIKKDGVSYGSPLVPNTVNAGNYSFLDLGPGTYILRTSENICNRYIYDTVTIRSYQFPNLNRSTAYQCDPGGFSVSAIASNGVAPYTYELIGSMPSNPSIISAPQNSSVFNINNGSNYSLIRLRALDACGNATLGDASILPLANNGISASENCFFYPTTLSVDPIYNATYSWYKKLNISAADSTFMGSGSSIFIPDLTPADTGMYVCYLNVNQGCIQRKYTHRLTGSCYTVLPVNLKEFKGKQEPQRHLLSWTVTQEQQLDKYIIERKGTNTAFIPLGSTRARGLSVQQQYQFIDADPLPGDNFYRLKMVDKDGTKNYSNTVLLQQKPKGFEFTIYPNPAKEVVYIKLKDATAQSYSVELYNSMNQLLLKKIFPAAANSILPVTRTPGMARGLYLLKITNIQTNIQVTERVVFL